MRINDISLNIPVCLLITEKVYHHHHHHNVGLNLVRRPIQGLSGVYDYVIAS